MPDTSPPDTSPPDTSLPGIGFPNRAPGDWHAAFTALPPVDAPTDGWSRMARTLNARAPRMRHGRWAIALAASAALLALVAWSPAMQWLQRAPVARPTAQAAAATPRVAPARTPASVATAPSTMAAAVATAEPVTAPTVTKAASSRGIATIANPRRATSGASRRSRRAPSNALIAARDTHAAVQPAAHRTNPLPALYSESARLEALVAIARDDRVASGVGAALSGQFDARIGTIDAALSQPDLAAAQRTTLWQQRVAALRELASVESTQRWLSAQGERFDGALATVD